MKCCVFGAGRMGTRHAANIVASGRANVGYVVDPDLSRATALANLYGGVASTDPTVAIADPSVDAVIIASPTDTHVALIISAAGVGKAIVCLKPIDLDMKRVELCEAVICDFNVPFMIVFNGGSTPLTGRCGNR